MFLTWLFVKILPYFNIKTSGMGYFYMCPRVKRGLKVAQMLVSGERGISAEKQHGMDAC